MKDIIDSYLEIKNLTETRVELKTELLSVLFTKLILIERDPKDFYHLANTLNTFVIMIEREELSKVESILETMSTLI